MIISVSRRTDIPAFYSEWFFNRLKDGEVMARNPYNRKQIARVSLKPEDVKCFVFWTKNCESMLSKLRLLKGYNYYFQFTLTAYEKDLEQGLEDKNKITDTFKKLSTIIGRDRVIWRYDPILINSKYNMNFHINSYEKLASALQGYTRKCVISFIDNYRETKRNAGILSLKEITDNDMKFIGMELVNISKKYEIEIKSCAEEADLTSVGINRGSCVDPVLIAEITGSAEMLKKLKKDKLRAQCECVKSIDIGEYNTCPHGCAYCYANYNPAMIDRNSRLHKTDSIILTE